MRKKLLTFIAIALCCIGSISADTSGSCGANLTWNLANGVLTISGTGKMNDYSTHGPWYRQGTINQVVIEDGVTYIGIHAFDDCSSITSVALGNSVDSIGWGAFFDCTNLSSINFPNSIKSIASYAFFSCKNLTSITIPNSVTNIGNRAFYDCPSLTTINVANDNPIYCSVDGVLFNKNRTTLILYPSAKSGSYAIPDGVTRIEKSAFFNCTNLTSVTIPNSVKIIEDQAFTSSDFTSVIIGNGITYFGTEAFQYCTSLTSVILVNGLKSIGDHAFAYCSSLTSIIIPNSVTSIGGGAFEYCSSLTSVTISNSVTSIESYTFYECSNLTSVTIPNSVTSIGEHAFQRCNSLTSVNITDIASWCNISFPDQYANPLYYGHNLYLNGTLVTDLVIPDGVTSIGEHAFQRCSSLTSVTIPNSVTSIGMYAFDNCSSLTTINVANDNPDYCSIDGVLFNKTQTILILYPAGKADDSYSIPNSVTSIVEGAFSGSSSLTSLACLAETPPQVDYTIFYYLDPSKIVLYVPAGSIVLYRADEQWNKFIDIRPLSFTVTFYDWDGTVLKSEEVEPGTAATAPADPTHEGYTFVGWDAEFTNVTSNLTVTATYSKPLTGRFSVSADKQVIFAQGNLQYKASSNEWKFANSQYDMVGENNAKISQNYGGWIDLYGWATGQNPWLATEESSDYGDGNDIAGTNKDWATHTIVNGGDDSWRTLTQEEWTYLLYDRADKANALGTVCGVHGMIILPDNWQQPAGVNFTTSRDNWSVNIYDAGDWSKMENAGAVFLPAAGRRLGTEYEAVDHWGGEWGYYWSSSSRAESTTEAFYIYFAEATISYMNQYRYYGYSVRPAHDVKANEGIENTQKEDSERGSKLLRDGVLLIERNGKTYNAQGAEVK